MVRNLSVAERRAAEWKRDAQKLLRDLARLENKLDKDYARVSKIKERTESLIDRHEGVEESLTAELRIYKDDIIPTWSLNLESLRSQVEADIALQAQRKAAYTMPNTRRQDE